MDVVNLDEIMTGIGLDELEPRGTGFCGRCLDRFRSPPGDGRARARGARTTTRSAPALQGRRRLFEALSRGSTSSAAFDVMIGFIRELRSYAAGSTRSSRSARTSGTSASLVPTFGPLWGCEWGPHLDFVLLENHYRVEARRAAPCCFRAARSRPAYRLGSSFAGAPAWICPSITVPEQLADRPRTTYHLLMFLEAYANGGRWGYYWWPGVDARRGSRRPRPSR